MKKLTLLFYHIKRTNAIICPKNHVMQAENHNICNLIKTFKMTKQRKTVIMIKNERKIFRWRSLPHRCKLLRVFRK